MGNAVVIRLGGRRKGVVWRGISEVKACCQFRHRFIHYSGTILLEVFLVLYYDSKVLWRKYDYSDFSKVSSFAIMCKVQG